MAAAPGEVATIIRNHFEPTESVAAGRPVFSYVERGGGVGYCDAGELIWRLGLDITPARAEALVWPAR